MEDDTTVCDVVEKGKPQEKPKEAPKEKGEGWNLVNRFAGPLKEFERFSVFMFIMALMFLAIGFVFGWLACMIGYIGVQ